MAKNPWALPDGFDDTVKKALKNLFASLKNAKKAIPPAALDAVRMGDWEAFQRMMDWHGVEGSFEIFKDILADEAKASAVSFYRNGGVGAKLTFDLIDERAVFYAQTRAAQLVTEITNDMRANIRNTITSATLGEKTWQQAADEINAVLPLTTKNAEAVAKYHTRQFERFMKKGATEAVARAKANKLRDAYAEKLTQSRASTIARTEIASAASEGRYLGWEAGVQSGLVDTASVKEWIAEPSACEICADMDGKTFPWDDEFPAGVMMPPAHPNCRCSAAILPPDYADSVFTNQAMIKSKANQFEVEFAKHMAGKHDQSSHAGGKGKSSSTSNSRVPYPVPQNSSASLFPDSQVSSTFPYVGLSSKAQAIAAMIGPTQQIEINNSTYSQAEYASANGKVYLLRLERRETKRNGKPTEVKGKVMALREYNPDGSGERILNETNYPTVGFLVRGDEGYSEILFADNGGVKGAALGTAMLEFGRREWHQPIFHSSALSAEGLEFARTTKSVEKHLAGKHDQSSHAGGRAAAVEAKPALRSFTKADWKDLPQATAENLSIDEQVALMSYQNNGYLGINQYLRNQTFAGAVFHQADAETLTNAVNRFTIDQDIVVKRGVDPSAFGLLERSKAEDFMALKGKAFVDKAFLSTATFTNGSKVIANPFFDNKSVQMKISVPKGSKGMATNPLEGEFLMPPNTTLFISDVRESNNGYEIDAEVVGQ